VRAGGKDCERQLTDMDRAIVLDEHDGLERLSGLGTVETVELIEMRHEVASALGGTGVDDEFAASRSAVPVALVSKVSMTKPWWFSISTCPMWHSLAAWPAAFL